MSASYVFNASNATMPCKQQLMPLAIVSTMFSWVDALHTLKSQEHASCDDMTIAQVDSMILQSTVML